MSYVSNYHETLAQYKKLLNSEKNDYFNAKISDLEKTANNLNFVWEYNVE